MKVIRQSHELLTSRVSILEQCKIMELAGRNCYKSENVISETSYANFLRQIIKSGHESVIEHSAVTVRFITNRAISHQIVRHRLCSYSQESMRYCNYTKDKFDNEICFIAPFGFNDWNRANRHNWEIFMHDAEVTYKNLILDELKPEDARGVLPQDTKTEIVVTANFRQWRHIFKERALNSHAQPQMIALMIPLFLEMKEIVPFMFEDLRFNESSPDSVKIV